MNRVLIVAYYFPPMGGSGVQRPLGLSKYLKNFGWHPTILAPEPGLYHTYDQSLMDEVDKAEIDVIRVEKGTFFQTVGKRKKISYNEKIRNLLGSFTNWFMLPDNKKGWIKPAVEEAIKHHKNHNFDVVFATGPPFSNHIIAADFKEETGVPVILDFRDDWLNNHFVSYPTKWHLNKMAVLESDTINKSDMITVVNSAYEKSLFERYPQKRRPVLLPNGYDPELMINNHPEQDDLKKGEKFIITHNGLFYNGIQPDNFLKGVTFALKRYPELADDLLIQFSGSDGKRYKKLVESLNLKDQVHFSGYKNHGDSVKLIKQSDLLLLITPDRDKMNNVTPGKMFEYFGTRKPVLALVPRGVSRNLLRRYRAALITHPDDISMISHNLIKFYDLWKENNLPIGDEIFASSFDRKKQAKKLAGILNSVKKG